MQYYQLYGTPIVENPNKILVLKVDNEPKTNWFYKLLTWLAIHTICLRLKLYSYRFKIKIFFTSIRLKLKLLKYGKKPSIKQRDC